MAVRLLLNLGTRHSAVGNVDRTKHVAGSVHEFGPDVEEKLIKLGHAELVAKPRRQRRKQETETPTEDE